MADDLISRLRALSRHEHSDYSIGDEAADALEAALKDTERMDFIERTYSGMTNRERYLPVTMGWGAPCNGRTLREACDKYMEREARKGLSFSAAEKE